MICSVCGREVRPDQSALRYPDGRAVHAACLNRIETDYRKYRAERMAEQAKRQRGYTPSERRRMRREGQHIPKEQSE